MIISSLMRCPAPAPLCGVSCVGIRRLPAELLSEAYAENINNMSTCAIYGEAMSGECVCLSLRPPPTECNLSSLIIMRKGCTNNITRTHTQHTHARTCVRKHSKTTRHATTTHNTHTTHSSSRIC